MLLVNEIFLSIQGEGVLQGTPTAFVRLAGCNLECHWCDTAYARDPSSGTRMEEGDVVAKVRDMGVGHACVTGGEPLLQEGAVGLVQALAGDGMHVSVETNGTIPIDPILALDDDGKGEGKGKGKSEGKVTVTMDVKCPSSGMDGREEGTVRANMSRLRTCDQLKFVVRDEADLAFTERMLEDGPVACPVVLQPVWGTDPGWLVEKALSKGLARHGVRVMVQLHKVIWGERRGV